jgi:succinate-acetate transporter protein
MAAFARGPKGSSDAAGALQPPTRRAHSPRRPAHGATPAAPAKPIEWGNSAPLALAAFAVTTFMLSMVNADFVSKGVEPAVFGVALMFGGITQLLAGLIQLRTGNMFAGVLFSGLGAFWLSLFAIAEFFLKAIPPTRSGSRSGCSSTPSCSS